MGAFAIGARTAPRRAAVATLLTLHRFLWPSASHTRTAPMSACSPSSPTRTAWSASAAPQTSTGGAVCGLRSISRRRSVFEAELADTIPVVYSSIAGCRIVGRLTAGSPAVSPCHVPTPRSKPARAAGAQHHHRPGAAAPAQLAARHCPHPACRGGLSHVPGPSHLTLRSGFPRSAT